MQQIPAHLRQHFYHLYAIALADLRVDPEELDMLVAFGEERGISRHQLEELLLSPAPYDSHVPEEASERIHCLYDMAKIALADGVVTPDEHVVLKRLASLFELTEDVAERTILSLLEYAKANRPDSEAIENHIDVYA